MGDFIHTCKWCRKTYTAKRPHSHYCNTNCRVAHHRLNKDFKLFDSWVAEDVVKEKYYVPMPDECALYLLWFRQKEDNGTYSRFADVYISKGCPTALEKRLKKMKLKYPIRYLNAGMKIK